MTDQLEHLLPRIVVSEPQIILGAFYVSPSNISIPTSLLKAYLENDNAQHIVDALQTAIRVSDHMSNFGSFPDVSSSEIEKMQPFYRNYLDLPIYYNFGEIATRKSESMEHCSIVPGHVVLNKNQRWQRISTNSRHFITIIDGVIDPGIPNFSKLSPHATVVRFVSEEYHIESVSKLERNMEYRTRDNVDNRGYVYLLNAIHDPALFKIGRTNNPDNRLKTFGVKLPFPVEYDCLIATDDMYALESELHARFSGKRLDGEWFRLSADDVDYIRQLARKDE